MAVALAEFRNLAETWASFRATQLFFTAYEFPEDEQQLSLLEGVSFPGALARLAISSLGGIVPAQLELTSGTR